MLEYRINQLSIQEDNMTQAIERLKIEYHEADQLVKNAKAMAAGGFGIAARNAEEVAAGNKERIKNKIDNTVKALEVVRAKLKEAREASPVSEKVKALVEIPKVVKVTDHAVVRWIERRLGVDVEAVRKAIMDDAQGGTFVKYRQTPEGTGMECRSPSGLTYIVGKANGTVVTAWGEAYSVWNGEATLEDTADSHVEKTG